METDPAAIAPPFGVLDDIDNVGIKIGALRAALELDVFGILGSGVSDADGIARAAGCSQVGMLVLLDALGSFGLLTRTGDRFEPTPTAAAYLVPGSPTYVADNFLDEMRARDRFTESVRLGRPARDVRAPDGEGLWAAIVSWNLADWPESSAFARSRWAGLGVTPNAMPAMRILDVGCGSGIKSYALAADDPGVTVTGIDSVPVLAVAARLADAMGVSDRVTLVPGDTATLPSVTGTFDIVLFGYVLHYLDEPEVRAALAEARRLLGSEGRVVIVTPLISTGDYTDPAPYLTAVWMLNVAPRGHLYSIAEFAAMLGAAGFEPPVRLEGTYWLEARRRSS